MVKIIVFDKLKNLTRNLYATYIISYPNYQISHK